MIFAIVIICTVLGEVQQTAALCRSLLLLLALHIFLPLHKNFDIGSMYDFPYSAQVYPMHRYFLELLGSISCTRSPNRIELLLR